MKAFKKKMVLFTTLAIAAISATGITSASATMKGGVNIDCSQNCLSKWEFTSYADSHYCNDEHYHKSSVRVGSYYYYSGGYSGNYNARPDNWSYIAKYRSWYQGYNCYYDNSGCTEKNPYMTYVDSFNY